MFVSEEKMSKKARAELNRQRRVTWEFSPVSRVKPSKKGYDRRAFKSAERGIA